MANNKKPRILFLYDFPLWGTGSANFMRHLISQLVEDRFKVAICAPEAHQFHRKVKQYRVRSPQIPVFIAHPHLKKAKKYSELKNKEITSIYYSYLQALLRAIADFEPNIIHVNHLALISWVARYAKSLTDLKYLITSHGSDLDFLSRDKRYHLLTSDALRGASQVTAVSGDVKEELIGMFGRQFLREFRILPIRVIPGGVNFEMFAKEVPPKIINKKYHLKGKSVILFAGRLIAPKGVRYLVRAAKDINGEVFIIGGGPEREPLMKLAKDLKLTNIHFTGYLGRERTRELKEFYWRADVFVAPSVWEEPLGLVILEAMACKTPVVVTRKGGIPLAVKNGVNGLFVKPRNASDIVKKVNRLLADKKLKEEVGGNARRIVKEKFTWKKIAKKFEYLYKKHVS